MVASLASDTCHWREGGELLGSYTVVASLASDKVEHVTGEKEVSQVG